MSAAALALVYDFVRQQAFTQAGQPAALGRQASAWTAGLVADAVAAAAPEDGPVACRAGCAWCCYVEVRAAIPEVLAVAEYVRTHLPPTAQLALRERLRDTVARTRGLDAAARLAAHIACPLLGADLACTVYPVRPSACVGLVSYAAAACRAQVDDPARRTPLPINTAAWHASQAVRAGLYGGTADAGLQSGPVDLSAALLRALETPASSARWQAGQAVFEDLTTGAVADDATLVL